MVMEEQMGHPRDQWFHIKATETRFLLDASVEQRAVIPTSGWSDIVPCVTLEITSLVLVNVTPNLLNECSLSSTILCRGHGE